MSNKEQQQPAIVGSPPYEVGTSISSSAEFMSPMDNTDAIKQLCCVGEFFEPVSEDDEEGDDGEVNLLVYVILRSENDLFMK